MIVIVLNQRGQIKCEKYRGIKLLNATYTIIAAIIKERLMKYTETILGEYRMDFRKEKSPTDAIHRMKQIAENEHNDIDKPRTITLLILNSQRHAI